jgi:SAM-dependent methyltransferase
LEETMSVPEALMKTVVRQFGHPTGTLGGLVGWVMANRPSNRERSRRTLELLRIQPEDRVLEIGFGPGLALAWAAELAYRGKVVGIDHSEVMLRQAAKRNAAAIAAGRVELHQASVDTMPTFEAAFDNAFAVNVYMFWGDTPAALRKIAAVLRPGGTLAVTHQPRHQGARAEDTFWAGDRIARDLDVAGFEKVRVELLPMKPLPAVSVVAVRRYATVEAGSRT